MPSNKLKFPCIVKCTFWIIKATGLNTELSNNDLIVGTLIYNHNRDSLNYQIGKYSDTWCCINELSPLTPEDFKLIQPLKYNQHILIINK